jgi:hypothetical protein
MFNVQFIGICQALKMGRYKAVHVKGGYSRCAVRDADLDLPTHPRPNYDHPDQQYEKTGQQELV